MKALINDAEIIWWRMIWVLCWYNLFLPWGEKHDNISGASLVRTHSEFYLAISPQLLILQNFDGYLDD